MVRHRRDRRRIRYTGVVAAFVFCALPALFPTASWGQDAEEAQQTASSRLEPARVAADEEFSLFISVSDLPVDDLSIEEPDYPDAISKRAGASIRELPRAATPGPETDRSADTEQGRTEIEIPFRAVEPGRVIIEPIVLRDEDGNTWRTERHLVEIATSADDDATVPFDVSWSVTTDTVYEGQTIPVFLNIERATSFSFPDEIAVEQPEGAVFEEVEGLGSVESEVVDEVELLRYPVATFLMTPSSEGDIEIPAASVGEGGSARRAQAREITVEQLPEQVRDSLAVGDYRFSAELSHERVTEGETTTLTMRVEGTGNLDFFQFPNVEADGATVGSQGEQSDVSPVSAGLVGSREQQLRITPQEAGETEVRVERFSWLDPDTDRVSGEGPLRFSLEVGAADTAIAETQGDAPFEVLSSEEIVKAQPVEMYRFPVFYLLFLPPLVTIALAFAGVGVKRVGSVAMTTLVFVPLLFVLTASTPVRELPKEELDDAVAALEEGSVAEAKWRFENVHEDYPRSPGVLYNLAYAGYLSEDRGTAVYGLREALRISPGMNEAREGLEWVEDQYGLDRQVQMSSRIRPDTALVGLFVLSYVMAGLAVGVRRRKDARYAIGFLSTGLLMLAGVIFMLYAVRGARVPTAVVAEQETVIRQVPVVEAKEWLTLPAGAAVRPRDVYGDYRLVHTGFGVEGWVSSDALLVSEP